MRQLRLNAEQTSGKLRYPLQDNSFCLSADEANNKIK